LNANPLRLETNFYGHLPLGFRDLIKVKLQIYLVVFIYSHIMPVPAIMLVETVPA